MMKKRKYETPQMKMIIIQTVEVIATSSVEGGIIPEELGSGEEWNVENADW